MASTKDDVLVEEGLLSHKDYSSSFDSEENRPIITKPSPRQCNILYTSCFILAGMAFSLAVLSLTASARMAALQPVSLYPGWELDPALGPGEEPRENGPACGTSPQEARERGCKFDLVLYSWVPAPCYDEEIQAAYRERESEWWRERGGVGGERIPQERAALGIEESLWLSWDYHEYHCKFIWKMMTRILRNASMGVSGRLLETHHTDHCIDVLTGADPGPAEGISTLVTLNYSTCYSRV
ncbi:hypothetical protein VM1G_07809 [Cytospora mali]|uniref:Uncharacterized protein n=1 Tax=Cytospora mali TaxID=578113 RepID=A0A194W6L5_CYTMA|nr:hypothetical protein VM1G_07809 [Valsa mali]